MRLGRIDGNSKSIALFLDFDGTLVDIAATPDSVQTPADLVPLLDRLLRSLESAVAIISGRRFSQIDRLLHPLELLGAGAHGAEFRTEISGGIRAVVRSIDSTIEEAVGSLRLIHPAVIVEPKGYSIAVHYRLAPEAEAAIDAALQSIISQHPEELALCKGRMVSELMPKGISKGKALEILMCLPQFQGRKPIMIGDDVSDQAALDAAERLGGYALRVAGEHFSENAAEFLSPSDVRTWLSRLAANWTDRHESIA